MREEMSEAIYVTISKHTPYSVDQIRVAHNIAGTIDAVLVCADVALQVCVPITTVAHWIREAQKCE